MLKIIFCLAHVPRSSALSNVWAHINRCFCSLNLCRSRTAAPETVHQSSHKIVHPHRKESCVHWPSRSPERDSPIHPCFQREQLAVPVGLHFLSAIWFSLSTTTRFMRFVRLMPGSSKCTEASETANYRQYTNYLAPTAISRCQPSMSFLYILLLMPGRQETVDFLYKRTTCYFR